MEKRADLLARIYYDPSSTGGYSSLKKLYKVAHKIDPTIKEKDVNNWLTGESTYTLHKQARRRYPRRKVITDGIDSLWQADLVIMPKEYAKHNSNYKYILTVIDVFSRYAFARPLKTKTGTEVASALKSIFIEENRIPSKLHVDQGGEFYSRNTRALLNDYNVSMFSVYSDTKAALVERWNRTLKGRMFKYFTKNNTKRYIDVLPQFVEGYNSSVHRITGFAPKDVTIEKQEKLRKKLYQGEFPNYAKFRFRIGDTVRIIKSRHVFQKGYLPLWTNEYFTVICRRSTKPVTYKLKDLKGNILKGAFYEPEMILIKSPSTDEVYTVEILKKRKKGQSQQYFVHYKGWPEMYDEWIDSNQLTN
jgi:transposase InsO family protein